MDWEQYLDELERQTGLAARYLASGTAGLGAVVANPIAWTANRGLEAMGSDYRFPEQYEAFQQRLTQAGLPEPEGTLEKVIGFGAEVGVPDPTDAGRFVNAIAHWIDPNMVDQFVNQAMTVFHGTPHKWADDKPDMSKIGTGEGAQAYGHGLYFAEDAKVAEGYRQLTGVQPQNTSGFDAFAITESVQKNIKKSLSEADDAGDWLLAGALDELLQGDFAPDVIRRQLVSDAAAEGVDSSASLARFDDVVKDAMAFEGHLYELDLPDSTIDKMLDWDAPLSEQPEMVQNSMQDWLRANSRILEESGVTENLIRGGREVGYGLKFNPNARGEDIYRTISNATGGRSQASDYLNSIGIPGIKYLDGTSRSAGEGTRNFVIFDDSLVTPLKRNGEALGLPMDEASRMARAREMGFDIDGYHGTGADVDEFRGITWMSESPKLANEYAFMRGHKGGDANVMPLMARAGNSFNADKMPKRLTVDQFFSRVIDEAYSNGKKFTESEWSRLDNLRDVLKRGADESYGGNFDRHDFWFQSEDAFGPDAKGVIEELMGISGFDSIKMREGGEQTIGIINPNNVRSKHAKFDPDKIDSARLDASIMRNALAGRMA